MWAWFTQKSSVPFSSDLTESSRRSRCPEQRSSPLYFEYNSKYGNERERETSILISAGVSKGENSFSGLTDSEQLTKLQLDWTALCTQVAPNTFCVFVAGMSLSKLLLVYGQRSAPCISHTYILFLVRGMKYSKMVIANMVNQNWEFSWASWSYYMGSSKYSKTDCNVLLIN